MIALPEDTVGAFVGAPRVLAEPADRGAADRGPLAGWRLAHASR